MPKIHKRLFEVPGTPVISNCGTPTEKVSEFLDSDHKSVMQEGWSYIKDFGDFIKKLQNIDHIPQDAIMVTADVIGLYPSIPHDASLEALKKALDNREDKSISTDDLTKMAVFVLKNNYFEFNGNVKKKISGTAIGTKFAPPYACIFMDQVETEFLKTQKHKPLVWFRYIDDVFFIWTHGKETLSLFLEDLNNFHPNIKFFHEVNKESIQFLDLNIRLSDGNISTNLYVKPTDRHQILHYTSFHPDHTKRSIVFSQALRVSRICSEKSDFLKHLEKRKSWFSVRWYSEDLVESEMEKVKFASKNRNIKRGKSLKAVPFVMTYHPKLKSIKKLFLNI